MGHTTIFESYDHAQERSKQVTDQVWANLGRYHGIKNLQWEWAFVYDKVGMDFIVGHSGHYLTTFMSEEGTFSDEWVESTAMRIAAWILIQEGYVNGKNSRSESEGSGEGVSERE